MFTLFITIFRKKIGKFNRNKSQNRFSEDCLTLKNKHFNITKI